MFAPYRQSFVLITGMFELLTGKGKSHATKPGEEPGQTFRPLAWHRACALEHILGHVSDLYLDFQSEPKLVPIDEQLDDDVMHLKRLGGKRHKRAAGTPALR